MAAVCSMSQSKPKAGGPFHGLGSETLRPLARPESAFSLVELLVVIAIVGILSAMLLPALARSKAASQAACCISNLQQLGEAAQLYLMDNQDVFLAVVAWLLPKGRSGGSVGCKAHRCLKGTGVMIWQPAAFTPISVLMVSGFVHPLSGPHPCSSPRAPMSFAAMDATACFSRARGRLLWLQARSNIPQMSLGLRIQPRSTPFSLRPPPPIPCLRNFIMWIWKPITAVRIINPTASFDMGKNPTSPLPMAMWRPRLQFLGLMIHGCPSLS